MMKRIACITGASSGIGLATAKALAAEGFQLILCGRRKERLEALQAELPISSYILTFDVRDRQAVEAAFQSLPVEWQSIDVLVNNAGINMKKHAVEVSDEDFSRIIQTNLNAVFALTREVGKHMLERKSGSIIMISSMAAYYGIDRVAAYASSKTGIYGLVRVLASEWSQYGLRVNAIAPGFIETAMSRTAMNSDPDRKHKAMDRTPAGHFGKPEDVAWAAVYLASDASSYVTGVSLPVDGGNSIGF